MRRNWGASLGYGALTVAFGWSADLLGTHPYYVAAAISGFLLVAPVMSAGFAEMSRRYSSGQSANFDDSLDGSRHYSRVDLVRRRPRPVRMVWFATSAVMLNTVFHIAAPDMQESCIAALSIR